MSASSVIVTGHTGSFNLKSRGERAGRGTLPGGYHTNLAESFCELEVRVETTVDLHQDSKV